MPLKYLHLQYFFYILILLPALACHRTANIATQKSETSAINAAKPAAFPLNRAPLTELPEKAKIVAKYIVMDEIRSPNHHKCDDTVKDFLSASIQDCSFKLQNMEFDLGKKIEIDQNGRVKSYWSYHAMGPVEHSIDMLQKDTLLGAEIGFSRFSVRISTDRTQILDEVDREIEIEAVFLTEKMVLMKQNQALKHQRRRILYQYR